MYMLKRWTSGLLSVQLTHPRPLLYSITAQAAYPCSLFKAFLVNCFTSYPYHLTYCFEELVSSFYDNRHACYCYDEAFEPCVCGPVPGWLR